jgi:integrase
MAKIRKIRRTGKDGKNELRYMLDYKDKSGIRRRKTLPRGTTSSDAKWAKLRVEAFDELTKRNDFNPIMTLEETLAKYYKSQLLSSGFEHANLIRQSHRQLLEAYGNIKMCEFRKFDGEVFQDYLMGKSKWSESTVRTYLCYAKQFFDWARQAGQIDFNIFDTIRMPRRQPSKFYLTEEQVFMTYSEVMQTSDPAKRIELQCLFLLLNQSGCRISEVLNTPPGNYDFKKNLVELAPVKKKQRNAFVHPDTMKLLSQLKSQNADKGVMFRHSSRWYGDQFKAIYQKLDIQYGSKPLHLLRHTFCTLAIEDGVGIEDISKFVGHSDSRVTEQNYVHVVPVIESPASDFGERTVTSLLSRSADDNMSHASQE